MLTTIDEVSLRIADSVLGRLVPRTPKIHTKPDVSEAGPKSTQASLTPSDFMAWYHGNMS